MQQPDVEAAGDRRGVAVGEIFEVRALRIAPPVDRDVEVFDAHSLRRRSVEVGDAVREHQRARDSTRRVVVAANDDHRDPASRQSRHARAEVEPGLVVAPVAVVDVAGQHNERDVLSQRQIHHVVEGDPGGATDLIDRGTLVTLEAAERAVEVQIGGVKELEHARARAGEDGAAGSMRCQGVSPLVDTLAIALEYRSTLGGR